MTAFPIRPLRQPDPLPPIRSREDLLASIIGRITGAAWRPAYSPAELAAETDLDIETVRHVEAEARDIVRRVDPCYPDAQELAREARLCACLVRAEALARRIPLDADKHIDPDNQAQAAKRALDEAIEAMGGAEGELPDGPSTMPGISRAAGIVLRTIAALDAGIALPAPALVAVARLCGALGVLLRGNPAPAYRR